MHIWFDFPTVITLMAVSGGVCGGLGIYGGWRIRDRFAKKKVMA